MFKLFFFSQFLSFHLGKCYVLHKLWSERMICLSGIDVCTHNVYELPGTFLLTEDLICWFGSSLFGGHSVTLPLLPQLWVHSGGRSPFLNLHLVVLVSMNTPLTMVFIHKYKTGCISKPSCHYEICMATIDAAGKTPPTIRVIFRHHLCIHM